MRAVRETARHQIDASLKGSFGGITVTLAYLDYGDTLDYVWITVTLVDYGDTCIFA